MRWDVQEEIPTTHSPGAYNYKSAWKFLTDLLLEHKFGELNRQNGGICMPNDDLREACIGVVFYKDMTLPGGPIKEIFMIMNLRLSALTRIQEHVEPADLDLLGTEAGRQKLFLHSEEIEAFLSRNPGIEDL